MPNWWHPSYSTALLEGQKTTWCQRTVCCRYQAKAARLCSKDKNYLVPKDGVLQVPGEGSTALLEGQKNYLVPEKYSVPQIPEKDSSMALMKQDKKNTWCQ
jgi:hypothetical protein